MTDREANRFSARAARYARVGANMGGVAARIAGARLFGITLDRGRNALELAAALGGLKGPIMTAALGAGWQEKFENFEHHPAAAASLGQVHRARARDGAKLACKLQYADMQ